MASSLPIALAVPSVDARAARASQALVGALVLAAAALGTWELLAVPAGHLALSAALGRRGNLAVRAFEAWIAPRLGAPHLEDARPPRFASLVGAVFLSLALLAHGAGASLAGWLLAVLVGVLAVVGASTGACLGCWMYGYLGPLRSLVRRLG